MEKLRKFGSIFNDGYLDVDDAKDQVLNSLVDTVNTLIDKVQMSESDWIKFDDEKPPHEVVLAACDTYDCGWTMDTVWWNEKDQVWMVTGAVESTKAHLPYTHWRKLPPFPKMAD